jgi:hypothetical protein
MSTGDTSKTPGSGTSGSDAPGSDTPGSDTPDPNAPLAEGTAPAGETPPADDTPAGDTPAGDTQAGASSDSADCAEIPAAAHVELATDIKLIVQFPLPADASQPPHKLTLTNEDGSYSQTLTFPSDCQPGDTDGTSVMTFDGLTDGHTYSLHGENGDGTYVLFDALKHDEVVTKYGGQGDGASSAASQASNPPAGDTGNDSTAGAT